ncbi:MAG TPA: DUF5668 domain-containing protein [Bryobacteraceae bacterium]|nr:DUF5668 domain-containing protein [Bryobacteraceae bacterium]
MRTSYELIRAVRGPVVLILLGVIFALDHAGTLGFERSWPILIIAIGVFKLIERLLAPPPAFQQTPPFPPAPPSAGGWQ